MSTPRTINAEHVALAYFATRAARRVPGSSLAPRWAAMSDTHLGADCHTRRWPYTDADPPRRLHVPPLLQPLERGYLLRSVERMRLTAGTRAVQRTFGAGIAALRRELATFVLR